MFVVVGLEVLGWWLWLWLWSWLFRIARAVCFSVGMGRERKKLVK